MPLPFCPNDLASSPRGDLLYVSTSGCIGDDLLTTPGEIQVYDVGGRRMRNKISLGADSSYALAVSPDGGTLYAAVTRTSVEPGMVGTTAELRSWRTGDLTEAGPARELGRYQPLDLSIAPDGRSMAVTGTNRFVDIRSADGAESRWQTSVQGDQIDRVSWSPDGRTLAISDHSGPIRLWDTTSRQNTVVLRGHVSATAALAFSPDGSLLTSGSIDSQVLVWPLRPEAAVRTLCGIARSLSRNDGLPVSPACS